MRITRRGIQIVLGLIWLLDGALQFQPFMFTRGFLSQIILPNASGQPGPLAHSITGMAHLLQSHLVALNAVFALIQVLIGVGLLIPRTVRPALALSFVWALSVWWFGEGLGNLLSSASPLTGAPGAVILYVVIGALVWPTDRPEGRSVVASGPFGEVGAKVAWVVLWLGMAALWLMAGNRGPNAVHDALQGAASGEPAGLAAAQTSVAAAAAGHGVAIAIGLAIASGVVALGVGFGRHPTPFLALGSLLSLAYWVLGQACGAILTGMGTDPNSGLLFVVLAAALYPGRRENTSRSSLMATHRQGQHGDRRLAAQLASGEVVGRTGSLAIGR